MILNNAVNVGSFIYCAAYIGPHERQSYLNEGNGHYHQWTYVTDGQALIEVFDLDNNKIYQRDDENPGVLYDHSIYKNMTHVITTNQKGLGLINFNPIPETRNLVIEIVKGPTIKEIVATDSRITVVCITGPANINDKELQSLQYAKIFPNKTINLKLSENAVVALVS